jgi:hypothetical protein
MIFGGPFDQDQERDTSLEEARRGHAIMVARAKTGMDLL